MSACCFLRFVLLKLLESCNLMNGNVSFLSPDGADMGFKELIKTSSLLTSLGIFLIIIGAGQSSWCQDNETFGTRIIGKWQSDKDKTLEWASERLGSEWYEALKKIPYGNLILQFTEKTITSSWAGTEGSHETPYQTVYVDSPIAIITVPHPYENRNEVRIIRFEENDCISIYSVRSESKEYFRRIK